MKQPATPGQGQGGDLIHSRVPPHDPYAEQTALACMVARPERLVVECNLTLADFYVPAHRAVFGAMQELRSMGRTCDLVQIAHVLEQRGELDRIGGRLWLAECLTTSAGHFEGVVEVIKEHAVRRKVLQAALNLYDAASDRSQPMSDACRFVQVVQDAVEGHEPAQDRARAFGFLPLSELLAAPMLPDWLIRGILEKGSLAALIGPPGCMKSFLAIDLGLCTASGRAWHGHAVPNPGPVFYIAGEGFNGLGKRIKAWLMAHGVDQATTPFFPSNAPAQLLDAAHAREVANAVAVLAEQHGPPRMIVVDTLNRNFGPGDENSSQDMTAFVAALDALRVRFGCAILVVHHTGLQDDRRGRGSSVLRAALDFEFILAAKGESRVLSCSKCKDHEQPQPLVFKPVEVGTGCADPETLQEITSCVLRLTDIPQDDERVELKGAKLVALEALRNACKAAGGPVRMSVCLSALG